MVQKLRTAGVPQKDVRELTGISERTTQRIQKEPVVTDADDEKFRKTRNLGRPSPIEAFEAEIQRWFEEPRSAEDGPLKSQEVLTRLRAKGYTGAHVCWGKLPPATLLGKTAVYDIVKRLRPQKVAVPIVRFEGLPGEFSQHDFGQRRVTFCDGSTEVVHFFASRLKYSRFVDVQITDNEQQETVVRCLLRAFSHFGGVPLMSVFDNMSSAVQSREVNADGSVKVNWTQCLAQLAKEGVRGKLPPAHFRIDCGFIPLACWPYRPQQKGSVENLVGFVKGNFFCGRTFQDRQDLKRQLEAWVDYVNTERECDATGEIPLKRLQHESLKACAHEAETYAFKVSVVVRPTARVHYRGMEYSVPAQTIGQTVTLHLQQEQVVIYLGERCLAKHPRFPENGKSSIKAEHAQELFQFQRGKPYAQRQILLDLDPMVEPYLTELVHRRPQAWEPDVDQMYRLYERIGRTDFLAAIALSTEERCFGSEYLLAIASHQESAEGNPSLLCLA